MNERYAPDAACAALVDLEPDLDAGFAGLQPQLRSGAGTADTSHANVARIVLADHRVDGLGRENQGSHKNDDGSDHRAKCAQPNGRPQRDFGRIRLRREVAPQTLTLGPEDRLHPVGDTNLAKETRQVGLDRLLADRQSPRNQLVRQPVQQ